MGDAATMVFTDATDHGVHLGVNLSGLNHTRCEGRVDVVRHLRCAWKSHRGGGAIERRGERSVDLWLRRGLGEGGRESEAWLCLDASRCISRGGIAGLNRIAGLGRISGLKRVAGLDRVPGLERIPGLGRVAGVNRTSRLDRIPVVSVTVSIVVGEMAMAGMTAIIVMAVMAVVAMTVVTAMAMPVMAIWLWMSRDGLVWRGPVHAGEVGIHCDCCSLCLLWLASGILK